MRYAWAYGFALVVGLVLSLVWQVNVWDECRAAGHSRSYCWRVVTK